jgi:hypothetical protein
MICAIIPQSSYMCKATGYCNIEPTLFEMGSPTSIEGGYVKQRSHDMYDNLIIDHFVGNVITFSVFIASIMMLLGQIIVLDRSALALEATNYIQIDGNESSCLRKGGRRVNNSTNDSHFVWNDNVGNTFDKCSSKKSFFSKLRNSIYQSFSMELGALSTSGILSIIFNVCAIYSTIIVMLILWYGVMGRDNYPFIVTLIAIFTAAGGSDVDALDFDEIDDIAEEINAAHKRT